MSISPDALIGTRYKLLDCLGVGGMGEVWKAQDTNFTRLVVVAVKLLKEDSTVADDARYRANVERLFQREVAAGRLTLSQVVDALDEAFNVGVNHDALRQAAESHFGRSPISSRSALAFFDEISNDTKFNENARHRRRLRDLFTAEANSVAVLQHPNIVRVTDFGEHDGLPFLVMDYIAGRTLHQLIQRRDPMSLSRRLRLMEDLCEGLGYAHSKDLIHRDIKPANLIIDDDTRRLKILDFGVARTLQVSAQRSLSQGVPIGTLSYMSPEQTRANRVLDNRSDIFSVGLVFYELLSHRRAFPSSGDIVELVGRIQRDPPPPLAECVPDLDPEVEQIVYKAIEKVPARRYQDLSDMHREIESVRLRLEAVSKRRDATRTQLMRPRPLAQQVTDLLDRATSAFETGDDHAVIEFCDQVLALVPEQSDAAGLKRQSQARVRTRVIEMTVEKARALVDRGELTAAGELVKTVEADSQLPSVRRLYEALHDARRLRRVATLLGEARAALAQDNAERALDHARAVIALDVGNAEASGILRQAQRILAEQHRRQIEEAIAGAQAASENGALERSVDLLSAFAGEPAVDARLDALRRQIDERDARVRALDSALRRAEGFIDDGQFLRASDALRDAAAIDANDADVAALKAWLEPLVTATRELGDAVRLLATDRLDDGSARLASAAAALAPYRAQYPAVGRELDAAEDEQRAAQRRAEERLRREAEAIAEREHQAALAEQERLARLVSEAGDRVTALIDRAEFDEAERGVTDMIGLAGSEAAVDRLRRSLASARAAAADAAARRHRDEARAFVARGQLDEARRLLQQVSPAHPLIDDELRSIGRAIVKRDEERRRAEEAERARLEAERKRQQELRLQAEQAEHARQEAERLRAEAERAREELENRAADAIAASDRLFSDGEHQRAIETLTAFTPGHARVEAKLREYRLEVERREALARAEADRVRLEAKRQEIAAARARRRELRQQQVARARTAINAFALDRKVQTATAAALVVAVLLGLSVWLFKSQPGVTPATDPATIVATAPEPTVGTPAEPPAPAPRGTAPAEPTQPPPPERTADRAEPLPRPAAPTSRIEPVKPPAEPTTSGTAKPPGPATMPGGTVPRPTPKELPVTEVTPAPPAKSEPPPGVGKPAEPPVTKPAPEAEPVPANPRPRPNAEEELASARREIFALVAAYASAYSAKDENRLRTLQPSFKGLDERTRVLARSVELVISDVQITPSADLTSAMVTARQTFRYDWRRPGFPAETQGTISWKAIRTPSGWRFQ